MGRIAIAVLLLAGVVTVAVAQSGGENQEELPTLRSFYMPDLHGSRAEMVQNIQNGMKGGHLDRDEAFAYLLQKCWEQERQIDYLRGRVARVEQALVRSQHNGGPTWFEREYIRELREQRRNQEQQEFRERFDIP